MVKMSISFWAE